MDKTGSGRSSASLEDPVEVRHVGDLEYRGVVGESFWRHE